LETVPEKGLHDWAAAVLFGENAPGLFQCESEAAEAADPDASFDLSRGVVAVAGAFFESRVTSANAPMGIFSAVMVTHTVLSLEKYDDAVCTGGGSGHRLPYLLPSI